MKKYILNIQIIKVVLTIVIFVLLGQGIEYIDVDNTCKQQIPFNLCVARENEVFMDIRFVSIAFGLVVSFVIAQSIIAWCKQRRNRR